jgi:flagellar basal body-associated protein FliL
MADAGSSRKGLWVAVVLVLIALAAVAYAVLYSGNSEKPKPVATSSDASTVVPAEQTSSPPAVDLTKQPIGTTNTSASGVPSKSPGQSVPAQFPT